MFTNHRYKLQERRHAGHPSTMVLMDRGTSKTVSRIIRQVNVGTSSWFWQRTLLLFLVTASSAQLALKCDTCAAQSDDARPDDIRPFDGSWLYVEDQTVGRPKEKQQPPMSVKFAFRVEDDAVVMLRRKGEERITLDGSTREVKGASSTSRYRGEWKNGTLTYEIESIRNSDDSRLSLIRRSFRVTPEGLLVHVVVGEPPQLDSVALYRHPQDIALPRPATAKIEDMAWLSGAWISRQGSRSTEERWSPPLGGATLGVSRTVSGGTMVAFEFLRIVERDGGLVYVAQPGGRSPTEFVLTKLAETRAVFDNPQHDFPQRIVYERSAEGKLRASIGFINGGQPHRFEFTRDDE